MNPLDEKFSRLGTDNAPGQEVRQRQGAEFQALLRGDNVEGRPVDFSHGDVDAFPPVDSALAVFTEGYHQGGHKPIPSTGARLKFVMKWLST